MVDVRAATLFFPNPLILFLLFTLLKKMLTNYVTKWFFISHTQLSHSFPLTMSVIV